MDVEIQSQMAYRWSDGDMNSKFFHSFAFFRSGTNKIVILIDRDKRLEDKNSISEHINQFFKALYLKDSWNRPTLDHLAFNVLGFDAASSLESEFLQEELKAAMFDLGDGKALGPDGFPLVIFQRFLEDIKEDLKSFYVRIPCQR